MKPYWIPLENNQILQGKDFYISYNPNTNKKRGNLTKLGNILLELEGKEPDLTDGEETALCYENRFDILTGDFRKEYEEAYPNGLKACKEVFKK